MKESSLREIKAMGEMVAKILKMAGWPKEFADNLETLYWKVYPPKGR